MVRHVSYIRRGQATIGGGGNGTSSSLVKNKVIQSAAAATSATYNTVDESSSMQLSAADCGEWLLGCVLGALLLADKKNENNNNNDDDDANDDDSDGEKKATSDLLLAAGVNEATVEQTVKELNWKVRAQRAVVFVVFVFLFVCIAITRKRTTCLYVVFVLTLLHTRAFIDNSFKVVRFTQRQRQQRRRRRRIFRV